MYRDEMARVRPLAAERQTPGRRNLKMATVLDDDLLLAFDFVSSAAPMEHRAYVSLDTGRIHWISEFNPLEDEEIPDDLETSDRYLEIPHKNDLDLGRNLVLRFAEQRLPHEYDRVTDIFRHRGAYRRYKELLAAEAVSRNGTRSKLRRRTRAEGVVPGEQSSHYRT